MFLWYQKSLDFDDSPENVSAEAIGEAKFDYASGVRMLIVELSVKITSGAETVKIVFRSKNVKMKRPIDHIIEEDLLVTYTPWVKKFEKSLRTFQDLINRCALRSKDGVSIWLTSLSKPWK